LISFPISFRSWDTWMTLGHSARHPVNSARNHGRTPPLGRSRTSETEVASCSGYNCRYLDCLGDDLRTACFLPFPVNKQLTNYPQAPHSQLPGQLTRSAQVRCAKANVGGS
jgi:hypothetical protein